MILGRMRRDAQNSVDAAELTLEAARQIGDMNQVQAAGLILMAAQQQLAQVNAQIQANTLAEYNLAAKANQFGCPLVIAP